jgi:hypothetical protein
MARFRSFLTSTQGVPRKIAAILAQRGTTRGTGLLSEGGFAVTADATKFKTVRKMYYSLAGVMKTKNATDNLTFSAAHTVTATKFGSVLIMANAAGAISTKVVASPQAYDSLVEARKHLPAPDAGKAVVAILDVHADRETDGVRQDGNLAISAVAAEKFKPTQTLKYQISGVDYEKAATDNLTFSAAHAVAANKFGIILVQINAAGAISTKVPGATQNYDDAPTALAALPAADAGKIAIGRIAIAAGGAQWDANTDDMTNGSDLTTATFTDAATSVEHDWVANTDSLSAATTRFDEQRAI